MGACSFVFTGKVLPERAPVTWINQDTIQTSGAADVSDGQLHILILNSQIVARFWTSGRVGNLETLRNIVEDAVRGVLDAVGYFKGYGYDVDITQVINPSTSETAVFGIEIPAVKDSATQAGIELEDVLTLTRNPHLKEHLALALADLRRATKDPKETGFHCYRALESLMHCCAARRTPVRRRDAAKWTDFRTRYSVAKKDIDYVKGFADDPRHGKPVPPISDTDRAEVFRKTWDIVNRFVQFEIQAVASQAP